MLASAEPSARFRLVCNRFARAAAIAAVPSGSSTIAAITTPTNAAGRPGAVDGSFQRRRQRFRQQHDRRQGDDQQDRR